MPKRIPGLSETILDQAALLFSKHGYEAVDMKQVAVAAGTSVGNLYNYHPSKPALFMAIKTRWKEDLADSCQEIFRSELPRRDKILTVLNRLYNDIASWHGLWTEFLSGSEERAQFMASKARGEGPHSWLGSEEQDILGQMELLLTGQPSSDGVKRWAFLLITATLQMAARYPSHREENWKFIETLVDKI